MGAFCAQKPLCLSLVTYAATYVISHVVTALANLTSHWLLPTYTHVIHII